MLGAIPLIIPNYKPVLASKTAQDKDNKDDKNDKLAKTPEKDKKVAEE